MTRSTSALTLKPDLADAARRWQAYLAGDLIDRPLVCVTAPIPGQPTAQSTGYRERATADIDTLIDRALTNAQATFFGGEAIPSFGISFGCDEPAVFCGAGLRYSAESADTCWSVPWVEDWEEALPLRFQDDHPLWQRMLACYRRAAARLMGVMALSSFDTHTNMDLLAAIRGPERLCLDLVERPEVIDRAMVDARTVFPRMWHAMVTAGRMHETGFCNGVYAPTGAAILQCDFSCMVSPAMFRRWILPALEEEAAIAGQVFYHWDGPGAIKHMDDLLACRAIHTLGYVPTSTYGGGGGHLGCLDLLRHCQDHGKAVQAGGTPEEIKAMHRRLDPARVMYCTSTSTPAEAVALLDWFTRHT
jgi:hypothetical protein